MFAANVIPNLAFEDLYIILTIIQSSVAPKLFINHHCYDDITFVKWHFRQTLIYILMLAQYPMLHYFVTITKMSITRRQPAPDRLAENQPPASAAYIVINSK